MPSCFKVLIWRLEVVQCCHQDVFGTLVEIGPMLLKAVFRLVSSQAITYLCSRGVCTKCCQNVILCWAWILFNSTNEEKCFQALATDATSNCYGDIHSDGCRSSHNSHIRGCWSVRVMSCGVTIKISLKSNREKISSWFCNISKVTAVCFSPNCEIASLKQKSSSWLKANVSFKHIVQWNKFSCLFVYISSSLFIHGRHFKWHIRLHRLHSIW